MNTNGYPSGTTERDRREKQEFAGIRAFAPLGDDDPAWVALREAKKRLDETICTGETNENRTDEQRTY